MVAHPSYESVRSLCGLTRKITISMTTYALFSTNGFCVKQEHRSFPSRNPQGKQRHNAPTTLLGIKSHDCPTVTAARSFRKTAILVKTYLTQLTALCETGGSAGWIHLLLAMPASSSRRESLIRRLLAGLVSRPAATWIGGTLALQCAIHR